MNIVSLEGKLEKCSDYNYVSIIEFIIDAVRTYPIYDLNDTDEYFNEVSKIFNKKNITKADIEFYLDNNINFDDEISFWTGDSLNSLFEAFDLMESHHISFDNVKEKINSLEKY